MKNTLIAILVLFFVFMGIHYLIFLEDSQKLIQVLVALAWAVAFHFAALKFIPDSYIFKKQKEQPEERS